MAGFSLAVVIAATIFTLAVGGVFKSRCSSGDWGDGRQYRQLCYSDLVPLYGTEHLSGGRLPFLNACPGGGVCDEYPVLTMYFMRAAAWIGHGYSGFFWANAALLSLCALITSWALFQIVGERALYFAVAPTLLIYAFVNWDLLAVAITTVATLALLRRRDRSTGVLLGLGAAAKIYPAFLVVPFARDRVREERRGGAAVIAVWSVIAFVALNLPFVMFAPNAWSTFFRFNSTRAVDWDSLWFIVCERLRGGGSCPLSGGQVKLVNVLSLVAFVLIAGAVWWIRARRQPDFPRWTLGFPVLVAFLLANKVYSPQYSLWLLPWFALALPNPWLFGAFELADVAVFVTRFSWFGRLSADLGNVAFAGYRGVPLGGFELAVAIRAAVLVACLVAWTLSRRDPLDTAPPLRSRPATDPEGRTPAATIPSSPP